MLHMWCKQWARWWVKWGSSGEFTLLYHVCFLRSNSPLYKVFLHLSSCRMWRLLRRKNDVTQCREGSAQPQPSERCSVCTQTHKTHPQDGETDPGMTAGSGYVSHVKPARGGGCVRVNSEYRSEGLIWLQLWLESASCNCEAAASKTWLLWRPLESPQWSVLHHQCQGQFKLSHSLLLRKYHLYDSSSILPFAFPQTFVPAGSCTSLWPTSKSDKTKQIGRALSWSHK